MDALVSINCITYNHEKYIEEAIESFLMQVVDFKYEIIIGEDCSTDRTRSIIEKYKTKYPDIIRVITYPSNVGMYQNIRNVLKASRGKYIAICEGDDYWIDPYKLQKQVNYLEKNPECKLCCHNGKIVNLDSQYIGKLFLEKKGFSGIFYDKKDRRYTAGEILLLNDIPTNSMIYRKECLENMPWWCDDAPAVDISIKFLTALQGFAYYMDEPMSAYRYDVPNSCTNKWRNMDRRGMIKQQKEFIALMDRYDIYSKGKFHQELSALKMRRLIYIYEMEGRSNEIANDENFSLYCSYLPFDLKAKEYIRCYFPGVFSLARYVYHKILCINP